MMNLTHARHIKISDMLNLRDLGGYACPGGVTRFGRFLRGDAPDSLSDGEIAALHRYGLRLAVDLRSFPEQKKRPSSLNGASGIKAVNIPIYDNFEKYPLDSGKSPTELYIDMIDGSADRFAAAISAMSDCGGAALFHCSVGKDRTGITAALILSLAGVSRDDIAADYALTNTYLRPIWTDIEEEIKTSLVFLKAETEIIETALDHIDGMYGGVEKYLMGAGLSAASVTKVRESFVVNRCLHC